MTTTGDQPPILFQPERLTGHRLILLDEQIIPALEAVRDHLSRMVDDEDAIAWATEAQGLDGHQSAAMGRSLKAGDAHRAVGEALKHALALVSLYRKTGGCDLLNEKRAWGVWEDVTEWRAEKEGRGE